MEGNYWSIKHCYIKRRSSPCSTVPHKVKKHFTVYLNLFQVFWVYLPLAVSDKGCLLASFRSKQKWNKAFGRGLATSLTWVPFCEAFRTGNTFWLYVFIVSLFNVTWAGPFCVDKICRRLQCYLRREIGAGQSKRNICAWISWDFFISSLWILSCLITTYNRLDWIGKWNTFMFQNFFRNGWWRHTHPGPEQSWKFQPQPAFLSDFGGSFLVKTFF